MSRDSDCRRRRLLDGIDIATQRGLELGALDRPTVTPGSADIRFADYRGTEALRRHYAGPGGIDPRAIVEVDIVLGEQGLAAALAGGPPLDYVIASHVIEHVPDVIGWLQQISAVLRPGGHLCLAIPDKRYSFDCLGTVSSAGSLIEAFLARRTAPSVQQVYDFYRGASAVSAARAWLGLVETSRLPRWAPPEIALQKCRELQGGAAMEVHCWRFTPRSFMALFEELVALGLTDFRIARFHDTAPLELEFFVMLEKLGQPDAARQRASIPRLRRHVAPHRLLSALAARARAKLARRRPARTPG